MKTIQQEWELFSKAIFRRQKISETQRTEMKKAFFAGATAMFTMVQDASGDDFTEAEGVAHLDAMEAEVVAFMQSIVDARRN